MNAIRLAVIASAFALFGNSESQAESIEPIGYRVDALCYTNNSGNYWEPIETFDNLIDAEDYKDFLLFLADRDFDKLLDELDLPNGVFVHGFDYRIVAIYPPIPQYTPKYRTPANRIPPSYLMRLP